MLSGKTFLTMHCGLCVELFRLLNLGKLRSKCAVVKAFLWLLTKPSVCLIAFIVFPTVWFFPAWLPHIAHLVKVSFDTCEKEKSRDNWPEKRQGFMFLIRLQD